MLLLGARVVPWVLLRIARMQSRELFLLVALTLSLGIALTAATLFGVSIALGAFLAGVVVAESPLSHQVGADVLPFREAFAVLFFVSVGMLVDPRDLVAHAGHVALLTTLIVVGKGLAALTLTLLLRQPALTALVVAAGLAQIGEFSFILGQSAVRLRMLSDAQYALVLAAALLSITLNPLLFKLVPRLERTIGARLGARPSLEASIAPTLRDHVVVVGAGRVGSHIVDVLGRMGVPRLVVESDAATVEDLQKAGVPVLYGDAGNSEILDHAGLGRARALVVTIPDDPAAGLAVAAARKIAPSLPIVARASEAAGVGELAKLGADDVIHPELEGGLELLRHTLLHVGFPLREVQRYAQVVRRESYATGAHSDAEHEALHALVDAARNLDITWVRVPEGGPVAGHTLAEVNLRARTGASVVALYRDGSLVPSPTPDFKPPPRMELGWRVVSATDPEAAAELLGRAFQAQMSGDLATAIDLYQRSIAACPTAEAHTFLGWTYSFQGRLEDAIEECQKAIVVDPTFGNPYNDIGAYLIEMGRLDEAIPWLERATRATRYASPHFPRLNLARVYLAREMYSRALEEFQAVVDLRPDHEAAQRAVAAIRRKLN